MRILTAAKHIKVSETDGFEAIMLSILLCPLLITTFCQGVRTQKIAFYTLLLWQVFLITIHGTGRSVYESLNTFLTSSFHHVQRALDIIGTVEQRHFDRAWDTAPGCLIQHIVNTFTGTHTCVKVFDVTLDELIVRVTKKQIHVCLLACTQVIEATNFVSKI